MIETATTRTTETRAGSQSDYYYPTRLGALRKAAGSLFDSMATSSTRKRVGACSSGNHAEQEEVA